METDTALKETILKIPKGDGNRLAQPYIAAMLNWKREVGYRKHSRSAMPLAYAKQFAKTLRSTA